MALEIVHGMYATTIGSARITSGDEAVFVVIPPLLETPIKVSDADILTVETSFKSHLPQRSRDSLVSYLAKSVLEDYVVRAAEPYKTLTVNIYANTLNLSLIMNTVLVACIDAGIPLKCMFACAGVEDLYVANAMGITPYYQVGSSPANKNLNEELPYVRESVEYAIRDLISFRDK